MKVGIITFHAAHNYGSMLQAYALQQTVISLGHKCEIINFRTPRQKEIYRNIFQKVGLKGKAKLIFVPSAIFTDRKKHQLFEKFLSEKLILSPNEYATSEELRNAGFDFDAYISGSDQIWNTICYDHDPAYFLDFVKQGRKIAYAPSMGPEPGTQVLPGFYDSVKRLTESYSVISVREDATAEHFNFITGQKPQVTLDPTLLLPSENWARLISDKPLRQKKYILLYAPFHPAEVFYYAKEISKRENMDIIVTQNDLRCHFLFNPHIKFQTVVGPLEFLNLVKNAALVVSASFHAVAFSLMLGTQLYAVNGMDDARVSQLLSMTGLERFAEYPEKLLPIEELAEIYSHGLTRLEPHIAESLAFLREALQ